MQNLDDDIIFENDIEDLIPNNQQNSCKRVLLIITIWVVGIILMSFVIPCPKVLKGNVVFGQDGKSAILYLSAETTGEIKEGQKVRLYIDNFPDYDYGCLFGIVEQFGNNGIPNEHGLYSVILKLKNGKVTNYGYTLPDNIQLQGYGEITVKEQSLSEVLIRPISKLLIKKQI